MTTIERIARAMAPSAFLPFDVKVHGSPVNREAAQRMWIKHASAALEAMKEPSEGMILAGEGALAECNFAMMENDADFDDYEMNLIAYRAMIQAALDEGEAS